MMCLRKLILLLIVISSIVSFEKSHAVSIGNVSAECAVLYDTMTGEVLYSKNADKHHLIASTTKIMTALVAISNCDLDEKVVIKPEHVRVEGSSMYLRVGETVTVKELLYGLLLMSGNDAGLTLGYHCGGDPDSFVKMMNEYSKKLGLENTSFENPHGLDGKNHYSTAYELALLTEHALENEVFREIAGSKNYNSGVRSMQNHNKLLWQLDGAVGVKTGYTKAAGRCLVSAVERYGRTLIAVTLNAPDDWNDHKAMYEAAFESMEKRMIAEDGKSVGKIDVVGGISESVDVFVKESIEVSLMDGEREKLEYEMYTGQFVYAPVIGGERAGKLRISYKGRVLCETELYFAQTVEQLEERNVFLKILKEFLAKPVVV